MENEQELEPHVGDIWIDMLGIEVEVKEITGNDWANKFWCEKVDRGSGCYRDKHELITLVGR